MTTRKPKLNLLYVTDSSMPWLQLAAVTAEPNPSQQHARRWRSVRPALEPQSTTVPAPALRRR